MDIETDAEIIARSTEDPSAFGAIFDRHAGALATYLLRRVGESEAEGLLGELFRIAFESRVRFHLDRPDARPWLYGIAANLVMKHHRSTGRRRRAIERLSARFETAPSHEDAVASAVDAEGGRHELREAIGRLDPRDRETLVLYAWEELSYAEIAEALAVPIGTVRSRLNRVRRSLREPDPGSGEVPGIPTLGAGGAHP